METPIDWKRIEGGFRDKYLDEECRAFCRWMIFGEIISADGIRRPTDLVDVAWADGTSEDVITGIPRWRAEILVEIRSRFVSHCLETLRLTTPDSIKEES